MRHNELCDGVKDLSGKAFRATHVRDDPLIFSDHSMQRENGQPAQSTTPPSKQKSEATEQKGNLLISDLLQNGTDSVQDMRVVNTDSKSHLAKTPEKCLQEA